MKTIWKTVLAAAVLAASAAAQAGAVDALKKFNADTDGISGSFSQTVKSKKKSQSSSGSFQILRPGLFKWTYNKPYEQVIVGDGKTIWLYDTELKQVTKSGQDQTIGDSPAAILSNKDALESSYTLKEDGSSNGIDYVLATPKRNNAGYQFWQHQHQAQPLTRPFQIHPAQRRGRAEPVSAPCPKQPENARRLFRLL